MLEDFTQYVDVFPLKYSGHRWVNVLHLLQREGFLWGTTCKEKDFCGVQLVNFISSTRTSSHVIHLAQATHWWEGGSLLDEDDIISPLHHI